MTDFGTVLPRRYYVGITSVLRMCAAVCCLAAVAVPSSAKAYRGFQTQLEAFDAICMAKLTGGDLAVLDEFDKLTDAQVVKLKSDLSSLGDFSDVQTVHAFYVGDANPTIFVDDGQKDVCQLYSFRQTEIWKLKSSWDAYVADNFRQQGEFGVGPETGAADYLSLGWATKPHSDGFVQLSMGYVHGDPNSLLYVLGAKVGKSPASCELWPEECL